MSVEEEDDLPPIVEGVVPTDDDMAFKASNGRYYLDDVWRIEREFPSADRYDCRTDLHGLVNSLYAQVLHIGYTVVDVSDRMNGVKHALQLAMAWASIVREARTTDVLYILRRTPENSGAMLMIQRQEHLFGQCSEMAPLAYVALVRSKQLLVTRDRVTDQDTTERMLLQWAKPDPVSKDPVGEFLESEVHMLTAADRECVPNMPAALFKQQMRAVQDMFDQMQKQHECAVSNGAVSNGAVSNGAVSNGVVDLTDMASVTDVLGVTDVLNKSLSLSDDPEVDAPSSKPNGEAQA